MQPRRHLSFSSSLPLSASDRAPWWTPVALRWKKLATREKLIVGIALILLWIVIVSSVAIGPALRTLQQAPVTQKKLDAELEQMRVLALEAQTLRQVPQILPGQAEQALRAATVRLGEQAHIDIQGDQANVTFEAVSGEAFITWLAEIRIGARARPLRAQITRSAEGTTYAGSVALQLRPSGS